MPAPAAGFNPFSGTSGRVRSGKVTADLNTDLVASAAYTTAASAQAVQDWAGEWSVEPRIQTGRVTTFESEANAEGLIASRPLRGGTVIYMVTIRGVVDGNSGAGLNSDVKFPDGGFVVVDLLYHKTSNYGFHDKPGKVVGRRMSTQVGADPAAYDVTIELDGHIGTPSYV